MSAEDEGDKPDTSIEQPTVRDYSHLKPWQFKPGQSGNPSGMPKKAGEFRRKSRSVAEKALRLLESKIDSDDISPEQLVSALKFLADRGGILAPDQLVAIESAYSRLMLQIADSQRLSEEQKTKAISQVDTIHREALGEDQDE